MPKRKTSSKYTRPGVEAAVHLLSLPRSLSSRWTKALSWYDEMLFEKGGDALVTLDRKRSALLDSDSSKPARREDADTQQYPRCITKDDLLNVIIPWKFTKGKPRNALKPLLQSNSNESVMGYSSRAFQIADDAAQSSTKQESNEGIKNAINELCNLKGVGPATASAILSISHPNLFVFMDDEIIEALHDGKRGYTLKIYENVNDKCNEICNELNDCQEDEERALWSRCDVGKALWSVAAMSACGREEELDELFDETMKKKIRKK